MKCYVYKGASKDNHYLFLPKSIDEIDLELLPTALLELLGPLSFVTDFDLTPERNLSQADAQQVLRELSKRGFYLQMPKKDMLAIENDWFNQTKTDIASNED